MDGLFFVNFIKDFFGQRLQLILFDSCNFSEQKLNPDPAEKAQHTLIGGKYLFFQVFILKSLHSQVKNAGSQLSLAKISQSPAIQPVHFMRPRNNLECLVTTFNKIQHLPQLVNLRSTSTM